MISPRQALDAINDRFGRHAGYRALHARGLLCRGSFRATSEGGRLTRASHMQGEAIDATVRFSNGAGDPGSPDYAPDVRGMATKLYLPDGSKTDISAQTVPRFPVHTPEDFIDLLRASKPGALRLLRLPFFLVRHPEVLPALRVNAPALRPPASYASCSYYAIHAFKWIDRDGGERWVRYSWIPEASEPALSQEEARSRGREYLEEELRQRLERQPVRFTLSLQIAAPGDEVNDPATAWPEDRETVAAGTLDVTGLDTQRETGDDILVFDPMRLTDGIEPSDDPVLRFRPGVYSESIERRTATRASAAG